MDVCGVRQGVLGAGFALVAMMAGAEPAAATSAENRPLEEIALTHWQCRPVTATTATDTPHLSQPAVGPGRTPDFTEWKNGWSLGYLGPDARLARLRTVYLPYGEEMGLTGQSRARAGYGVALRYWFSDRGLAYFSAVRSNDIGDDGSRSPGFASNHSVFYELGLSRKPQVPGLSLTASLFYNDNRNYKKAPRIAGHESFGKSGWNPPLVGAARFSLYGADLAVRMEQNGWEAWARASAIRARYREYAGISGYRTFLGTDKSPDIALAGGIAHTFRDVLDGTLKLGADVRYITTYGFMGSGVEAMGHAAIFGATADWRLPGGTWHFSGGVQNILNTPYPTVMAESPDRLADGNRVGHRTLFMSARTLF